MVEKDREREVIHPTSMTFVYGFGKRECHRLLTGVCSLDRTEPDRTHDVGEDGDYDFCPTLLESMTNGAFPVEIARRMPIDILQLRCGHWEFNDGQHRTCIAQRKKLTVEAEVSTDSTRDCDECDPPEYDDDAIVVEVPDMVTIRKSESPLPLRRRRR